MSLIHISLWHYFFAIVSYSVVKTILLSVKILFRRIFIDYLLNYWELRSKILAIKLSYPFSRIFLYLSDSFSKISSRLFLTKISFTELKFKIFCPHYWIVFQHELAEAKKLAMLYWGVDLFNYLIILLRSAKTQSPKIGLKELKDPLFAEIPLLSSNALGKLKMSSVSIKK